MKWQVRQKIKRIAALLLSFVLLFDALEISAPAPVVRAMEESFGAFCAVTSFAELPQELREQTLQPGAQESDIVLPDSLSVTANVLKELPANTTPAQTANAAQSGASPVWNDEIPEEEEILDADAEPQAAPQTPAQPQTTPTLAAQDGVSLTVDGVEEIPQVQNTVTLGGVQWRIDAARSAADTFLADEEHAGATYTYVAVLPEKDSAGNTVVLQEGAELPEIHVSVEGEKDAEAEASGEKQSETEKETETEKITEKETKTETETRKETDAEQETGSDLAVEKETGKETEIEKFTEAETRTEELTEKEIETEEETDAEKETGSDKAVEEETESETEIEELTEGETEEISETESEMEELTEAETETEEISETESEIETEIEAEIEEQEVSLMSLAGDGENGAGIDLKPYITNVEFTWTDKNGIQWPIKGENGKYEFPTNHTLGFKLHYHMDRGVVTPSNNKVTYQLPKGFDYTDTKGDIVWGDGKAGTYEIKDGVVTLTFDPDSEFFKTDTDFTGYITFDSYVSSEKTDVEKHMSFSEEVDFTYTFVEKKEDENTSNDSSFNADKSCVELNDSNIKYKIVVTSGKNGATNVTLRDDMSVSVNGKTLSGFEFNSFAVKDNAGNPLVQLDLTAEEYTQGETVTEEIDGGGKRITTPYTKDGETVYKIIETKDASGTTATRIVPEKGFFIVDKDGDTYIFRLPDMEDSTEEYTIEYTADLTETFKKEDDGIDPNWDNYTINNSVTDSNRQPKDNDWQSHSNTWIKKTAKSVKPNADGNYEIVWTIEINPEHGDLPLDAAISDTLDLPKGIFRENGALTVTVTDGTNNAVKKTDSLEKSCLNNSKVSELLGKLGVTIEQGATTTKDGITIEYTTTVDATSLPNGTTRATNTAGLTKDGHGPTASASADMQNTLLKKEADGNNARLSDASDKTGVEERVLLIPWKVTVKMDKNLTNSPSGPDPVAASIVDTFGEGLWVTPEYLQGHLTVAVDGAQLNSDQYVLTYTMANPPTKDSAYQSVEGIGGEKTRITGFKVTFKENAYTTVAGKGVTLDYTLFGDTEALEVRSDNGVRPSFTYENTVWYGDMQAEAEYTKEGTLFRKEYVINGGSVPSDSTIWWQQLKDGRITWRVYTEVAETSLGKDLTITDRLPGTLELYSVMLQRYYNSAGCGTTEALTEFEIPRTYKLKFTGMKDWQDQETGIIEVVLSKDEITGETVIKVTIPKELIRMDGSRNIFNLEIEAAIPERSDLANPEKLDVKEASFTNSASLEIDGEPSGEDTHTVTVQKNKERNLEKDGTFVESGSSRIMHYKLIANPDGSVRFPQEKGGKGILTLEDTLDYKPDIVSGDNIQTEAYVISLVPGSVKAYYYNESGQKVYLPAKGKSFSYTYEETDEGETSAETGSRTRHNKLTMLIPDATPVYIEYDYELKSNQVNAFQWQITNKAILRGEFEWPSQDTETVEYQKSSAGVDKHIVNFYKVDSANYNIVLPDARFILYEWKPYDGVGWTKENAQKAADSATGQNPVPYILPEGDDSGCWVARKEESGSIQYYVSDSKGHVLIEGLNLDTLYWLKETKAPVGYEITKEDYYFYLAGGDTTIKKPIEDAGEIHELSSGTNTVYITNELVKTNMIAARKVWADGTTPKDVELTLYQGDDLGYTYEDTKGPNPSLTLVSGEGIKNPQKIAGDATGDALTVKWEDLPNTDENGKQIYYYVFETEAGEAIGDPKILFLDGNYTINGYAVEYGNNNGLEAGIITVTNRKASVSAKKVWAEGTTPVNVEFTLYQSTRKNLTNKDFAGLFDGESGSIGMSSDLKAVGDVQQIPAAGKDKVVSWNDLPVVDDEGNPLYYYVLETKADSETPQIVSGTYMAGNFEVSYDQNGIQNGTVTVTNTATKIKVKKRWDGVEEAEQKEIEVQLYQSFTPPKSKEELAKEKEIRVYIHTPNKLDFGFTEEKVYNGDTYILAKEDKISGDTLRFTWTWNHFKNPLITKNNFSISCDGSGQISSKQFSTDLSNNCTYQLSWEISGLEEDSCNVYVSSREEIEKWASSIVIEPIESRSSGIQLPDATPVTQNGKELTATLNQANNWEHTWENLPSVALDLEGNLQPVYYYVKETEQEDYSPKYTYEYNEDGSFKIVTITNSPKVETDTDITVEKQWRNAEGKDMEPGADWTVTLQLWQQKIDGEWSEFSEEDFDSTITLPDEAGNWSYTWEGLPLGNYYVKEVSGKDGFKVTFDNGSVSASEDEPEKAAINRGTITVINQEQPAEIEVVKEWQDDNGEKVSPPSSLEVQMQLYQSTTPPAENKEPDPGTQTGKKEINLYIKADGFSIDTVYARGESKTDSAVVKIAYTKTYYDLESHMSEMKLIDDTNMGTLTITEPYYDKESAPDYSYIIYNISGLSGFEGNLIDLTFDAARTWPEKAGHLVEESSLPTSPDPGTTTPDDGDVNEGKLILPGVEPMSGISTPIGAPVTLSGSKLNHKWTNLSQYDANGNKLYYYVDELNKDQYDPKYTYEYIDPDAPWKGIKLVTVTNTLPDTPLPKKTSVKVTKEWKNSDGEALDTEVSNYQVKVQLQRREKGKTPEDEWKDYQEPIIIMKDDDKWTHTWSDLEWKEYVSVDVVSCEYEYRVQEVEVYDGSPGDGVKVDNFEPTYSDPKLVDDGFEFTITNTKKRQGITLPGTGSKYPWIFYGIGTTFLLIALAWMSRALKKSYIPSDTGKGGRQSDE